MSAAAEPDALFAGGGELGRVMAAHDWTTTSVGPPHTWPPELRGVVRMLLTTRFSMWLAWGPELAFFYNDAYRRDTLRAKHPWALGRPACEVWAEIWDDIGPRIQHVLDTGEATWDAGLLLVLERSGYPEESYHTFSYSPLADEAGRVRGMLCVVSEDTERVLGERRLRVLSELGDVTAVTAPTVEEACAATVAVLRRSRADVPFSALYLLDENGAAWLVAHHGVVGDTDRLPPRMDRMRYPDADLWEVLDTARPRVLSGLSTTRPGMFLPLDLPVGERCPDGAVAIPLTAAGGEPVGVLFAGISPFRALDEEYRRFLDLVARQVSTALADARALQAQRRRADELAELDRSKTAFFTGVSHELRTPLTLIAGPAEDALADREEPLGPAQRTRMEMIARNGGRLRRLVDTLLEFSRLEGGQRRPDRVAVDLAALTRGIAESFAPAVTRAGLTFTVDCPPLRSTVAVDVEMWEKVVLNLLSNAVKYTLAGTVSLTLAPEESGGVESGGVRLEVSDTGIGVAETDQPLLFRRFHRVRGVAARSHEGSGIGLALVAELTALHEGTVGVDSRLGRGSTFTVALPASASTGEPPITTRASAMVGLYREEALQWTEPDDEPLPTVPLDAGDTAGATVLVAEDNADLRGFLARLLGPYYTVLVAADGHTALQRARTTQPDLVLSDVMMPGLDGFGLLTALRAHPSTSTIPVVLLSARAGEEAAIEGLSAGADDYLVKPFSSADLLARVRSNLAMARVRNQESAWRTALLNAMQDGLFVLSADGTVLEVNEAFRAILGFGADELPYPLPHPWWPDPDDDPEGAAELRHAFDVMRERGGGRFVLPLAHRDGHRVWIEAMVDAVTDRGGGRELFVGTIRDVTRRRRVEARDRLLADIGRLPARPGTLAERLDDLVAAAVPLLGDLAVVSLAGPDGSLTPAAAHHADADVAAAARAAAPIRLDAPDRARHLTDGAFSVDELPGVPPGLTVTSNLVVPLVLAGRLLGRLTFAGLTRRVPSDAADVDTAEELGRRVALMIETDRLGTRERQLHEVTAALAGAGTVAGAAGVLVDGIARVTGAVAAAAWLHRGDGGLDTVHLLGDPARLPPAPAVEDAVRTGVAAWDGGGPGDARAALPLPVGGRVVGALTVGFAGTRAFDDDERAFLQTLAGEAGLAFERAALADARRELAETLQRSLLPPALPEHDRVGFAARYLPAASGSRTGGDWYDVLTLDDDRVAVVVGDVVGQGPAAAAVMGQLRSALSAYLLQSGAPAHALTWLDRYSHRVPGARASTAICVVLDTRTGDLRWACAGHPPPLVLCDGQARYLDDAAGTVLGVHDAPPFVEGHATLSPGDTLILYTDGLVERRGEVVDEGFDRLAAAAARATGPLQRLVPALLRAALDGAGPADDVALIVARLRPAALVGQHTAVPAALGALRREIEGWSRTAALPPDLADDLQLAVGEAVANAVEHAYAGRAPGGFHYRIEQDTEGGVHVEVGDDGDWQPPGDPGYRGRGLLVIEAIAPGLVVDHAAPGTRLRFVLPCRPDDTRPADAVRAVGAAPRSAAEAVLTAHEEPDGGLRLRLVGVLDLETVPAIRAELLARVGHHAPVVLDLREIDHLASAGVGLLLEAADVARGRLRVRVTPGGPVARVLTITGVERRLGLIGGPGV